MDKIFVERCGSDVKGLGEVVIGICFCCFWEKCLLVVYDWCILRGDLWISC